MKYKPLPAFDPLTFEGALARNDPNELVVVLSAALYAEAALAAQVL
jgi:hypothetical protein